MMMQKECAYYNHTYWFMELWNYSEKCWHLIQNTLEHATYLIKVWRLEMTHLRNQCKQNPSEPQPSKLEWAPSPFQDVDKSLWGAWVTAIDRAWGILLFCFFSQTLRKPQLQRWVKEDVAWHAVWVEKPGGWHWLGPSWRRKFLRALQPTRVKND